MNIDNLKTALTPWLKEDTWHTSHPLDDQRFHRALKAAFGSHGIPIAIDDFREAMAQLMNELHPNMQFSYQEELEEFGHRVENIGSYLRDNS